MPDYKEMYLTMIRASEKAINTLVEAQKNARRCISKGRKKKQSGKTPEIWSFPFLRKLPLYGRIA